VLLGGLLTLLAGAIELPDGLREDGDVLLGCTEAGRFSRKGTFPPELDAIRAQGVLGLGLNAHDDGPLWLLLHQGQPVQVIYTLSPTDTEPSPLLSTMAGPNVTIDVADGVVTATWPDMASSQARTGLLAAAQRVAPDPRGCTFVALSAPTGSGERSVGAGVGFTGPDAFRMGANLDATNQQGQKLPFGDVAKAVLGEPAPAVRQPLASTWDTPREWYRLNARVSAGVGLASLLPKADLSWLHPDLASADVQPGTEVGRFSSANDLAVLALLSDAGKLDKLVKKSWKKARKSDLDVRREADVYGVRVSPDRWLFLQARDQELLLTTTPELLLELADPSRGNRWIPQIIDAGQPGIAFRAFDGTRTLVGQVQRDGAWLEVDAREASP